MTTKTLDDTVTSLFEKRRQLEDELEEVNETLSLMIQLLHERQDTDERLNKSL